VRMSGVNGEVNPIINNSINQAMQRSDYKVSVLFYLNKYGNTTMSHLTIQ